MITEHKNAGSAELSCRLTAEDRDRIGAEIDIAGLDVQRIRSEVDDMAESLKQRKKDLEAKQAEIFEKINTRNRGAEDRSVIFDELHDHDQQRVFKRRQDTGLVFGYRNMREEERLSAPGQLDLTGAPEQEEPEGVDEIRQMIESYLVAHPPADESEDDPTADDEAENGVAPGGASAPDEPTGAEVHRGRPTARVDAMRHAVLSRDGDLDTPELLRETLAALGYSMPLDPCTALDADAKNWVYLRRMAWQIDNGLREGAAIIPAKPSEIPAPPSDMANTDLELSYALAAAGYFLAPEDLEGFAPDITTWEQLRRFAAGALPFDVVAAVAPIPDDLLGLEDHDLSQSEPMAALFRRLGYQLTDDAGEELDAVTAGFASDDASLNIAIHWAAAAWGALLGVVGELAGDPPEFLEPFKIEEHPVRQDHWIGPSDDWQSIGATPPDVAAEQVATLEAGGKKGLDRLREIAAGLAGEGVEPGFYDKKARKTCARAILAMIEERHDAQPPVGSDEDLDAGTPGMTPYGGAVDSVATIDDAGSGL